MDVRARLRQFRGSTRKLLSGVALVGGFGLGFPWLFADAVQSFGRGLASGTPSVGTTAAAFLVLALWSAYVGAATALDRTRLGTVGPLLRTSLAPRAIAGGRLLSELAKLLAVVVVPMPLVLALVAVGSGGVLAPILLVVGAVPVVVATVSVGRAVAATVRLGGLLSGVGAWTKTLVLVVVTGGFYVGSQVFVQGLVETDDPGTVLEAFVPGTPLQAYANVVLAPFGARPSVLGVAVALAFLALAAVGVAATLRVEVRMLSHDADADEDTTIEGSRDVPRPFAYTRAGRVAWRRLLRTARDPKSLAHLFPLSFMLFAFGASFARDPSFAVTIAPGAGIVLGGVFAGAAFCLNPLGDDHEQLPLLLSSVQSTNVLLRGRALAGGIVGVSIAVLAIAANAVLSPPAALAEAVVFYAVYVAFAVFFAATAAGTALGVGATFPQFERREYMNVERAHPSTVLLIGYFLGTLLVGVVGVVLVVATLDQAFHDGVTTLAYGGWVVYLAVTLTTGVGGYVYAVRRFDAFTLDDV